MRSEVGLTWLRNRSVFSLEPRCFEDGQIDSVEVVDGRTPLTFMRETAGFHVEVPKSAIQEFGVALRIAGAGLVDAE